jgi:hypothetical protein
MPFNNASLSGQIYVCPNSMQSYSITSVMGATSYAWSIAGNATVVSANGTNCTIQTASGWNGGTLTVTATNACGSSSRSFTLRSVPLQPGVMSGPMNGLCAYNGVTTASYSISSVTSATSYSWTLPPGMTVRNVNGTSITVNIDTSFRSGLICVSPVNSCGQGAARCMALSAYPNIPGTISGSTDVCKSDRSVSYSISSVAGSYHYVWAISGGAYLTTVSTGLSATVDYYWALTSSALLSVQSANLCGTSSPQQQNINVNLACRLGGAANEDLKSLIVYPNPARELVYVDFNQEIAGDAVVELMDVLGRTIAQRELIGLESGRQHVSISFDAERYTSGVYLLRVSTGSSVEEVRLVVE